MRRPQVPARVKTAVRWFARVVEPRKMLDILVYGFIVVTILAFMVRERAEEAVQTRAAHYRTDLKSNAWSVERERYTLVYPLPFHDLLAPGLVEAEIVDALDRIEKLAGKFRTKPYLVVGIHGRFEPRQENGLFNPPTGVAYVFFAALRGVQSPDGKRMYFTVAHELMHHRVNELRKELGIRVPRYLDEGLAHYVEDNRLASWGSPYSAEGVTLSKSDLYRMTERLDSKDPQLDQEYRRAGWATVHFLIEHRKLSVRDVLLLAERDAPDPAAALADIRNIEKEKNEKRWAAERKAVEVAPAAPKLSEHQLEFVRQWEVPKAFALVVRHGAAADIEGPRHLMPSTPRPTILLAGYLRYRKSGDLKALVPEDARAEGIGAKDWPALVQDLYGGYLREQGLRPVFRSPWFIDVESASLLKREGPVLPEDLVFDRLGAALADRARATGWAVCYTLWKRDGLSVVAIDRQKITARDIRSLSTWAVEDVEKDPNCRSLVIDRIAARTRTAGLRLPHTGLLGLTSQAEEVLRLGEP